MNPPPKRPAVPGDTKEALYQALQGAVEVGARKAARGRACSRPRRGGSRVVWGSLLVLAGVGVWLGVTRPAVDHPGAPGTAQPRVQRRQPPHAALHGEPEDRAIPPGPRTAATNPGDGRGGPEGGHLYHPVPDETFRLVGVLDGLQLTFASTDSVAPFLKNSFEVLSRREVRP